MCACQWSDTGPPGPLVLSVTASENSNGEQLCAEGCVGTDRLIWILDKIYLCNLLVVARYRNGSDHLCICTFPSKLSLAARISCEQAAIHLASLEDADRTARMHRPINAVTSRKNLRLWLEPTLDLSVSSKNLNLNDLPGDTSPCIILNRWCVMSRNRVVGSIIRNLWIFTTKSLGTAKHCNEKDR